MLGWLTYGHATLLTPYTRVSAFSPRDAADDVADTLPRCCQRLWRYICAIWRAYLRYAAADACRCFQLFMARHCFSLYCVYFRHFSLYAYCCHAAYARIMPHAMLMPDDTALLMLLLLRHYADAYFS